MATKCQGMASQWPNDSTSSTQGAQWGAKLAQAQVVFRWHRVDITGAPCAPGDEDPLEQVEDEFDRIVMKCHTFQAILLF